MRTRRAAPVAILAEYYVVYTMKHMSRSDQFEWDDDKAAANEAKHGIPFRVAARACLDPRAVILPDPYPAEERFRITSVRLIFFKNAKRR